MDEETSSLTEKLHSEYEVKVTGREVVVMEPCGLGGKHLIRLGESPSDESKILN